MLVLWLKRKEGVPLWKEEPKTQPTNISLSFLETENWSKTEASDTLTPTLGHMKPQTEAVV